MKYNKKIISAVLCLAVLLSACALFCSCSKNSTLYEYADKADAGTVSAFARSLQYLDGGRLKLVVGVKNDTEYTKILDSIVVEKLTDDEDRDIVEGSTFTLDEKWYITPGQTLEVPCVFEAEQVQNKLSANDIKFIITPTVIGCVKDEPAPDKNSGDGFAMTVTNGEITETGGFDGSVCIINNYDTAKTINTISFDVVDNQGRQLNINKITKTVGQSLDPAKTLTLSLALSADNVNKDIVMLRDFDMLYIKNLLVK